MATPAAPTNFVIVDEVPGESEVTFQFNHDGINLNRFEFLYRDPGAHLTSSWGMVSASELFVSGTTYEITVESPPNRKWSVRALSGFGIDPPSPPATAVTKTARIHGVRIKVYKRSKLQNGSGATKDLRVKVKGSISLTSRRAVQTFESPFREEFMYQFGKMHMDVGSITGYLANDDGVGASTYRDRIKQIIRSQETFRIHLITENHEVWSVVFPEDFDADLEVTPDSLWNITLPFGQIAKEPRDR